MLQLSVSPGVIPRSAWQGGGSLVGTIMAFLKVELRSAVSGLQHVFCHSHTVTGSLAEWSSGHRQFLDSHRL